VTDDPIQYLFSLELFGIKFGLENIRAMAAALGHPERAFHSVHVAGTNGKGSVTAMVDAALRAAGHRSARYTSPHLVDLTERFVIDDRPVGEEDLAHAVRTVRDTVRRLQDRGELDVHPTFFEVTTAAAFELFRRARVDVAVCEVGLGGRLDATNVLMPMVTAITSIGFDHEQYLGSTLADIAAEKAGIIKRDIPVIVGDVPSEADAVIRAIARDRNAPVTAATDSRIVLEEIDPASGGASHVRLRTPSRDYGALTVGLAGRHQVHNAVVAVLMLEAIDAAGLPVPLDAVREGLARVRWPGRLERIALRGGREVLLDAAHNPSGAATLAAFLSESGSRRPLVFAAMRDKDARGMLAALLPHASSVVMTRASHPRSADPLELAELARTIAADVDVLVEPAPAAAIAAAWRQSPAIVVAGSIFLLGDVMKELPRA
jgi:dihydrofolate synthase/folylpolyglutamate synthase